MEPTHERKPIKKLVIKKEEKGTFAALLISTCSFQNILITFMQLYYIIAFCAGSNSTKELIFQCSTNYFTFWQKFPHC